MNRKTWILLLALAVGLCLIVTPLMAADEGHRSNVFENWRRFLEVRFSER